MSLFERPKTRAYSGTVERIRAQLSRFKVLPAQSNEIIVARTFAAQWIGQNICSAESLGDVHDRSGAGLFLTHEEGVLTGALAFILMSPLGLAALKADRFDAIAPDMTHVATTAEEPAAVYAWGVCASTRQGARRVVAGGRAISDGALAHLPCFGRTATEAGRRLLVDHLTFRPHANSMTGLLVFERPSIHGAAA